MLAQLNSKQKSIFLSLKPTVIDKLISRNKTSIQNFTNEESEESISDESEVSSSSSRESIGNVLTSAQHSVINMAPARRNKVSVLASKIASRSQFPEKRGPGRPSLKKKIKISNNLKVTTDNKGFVNSKRGPLKQGVAESISVLKRKRNTKDSSHPEEVKRSQNVIKNDSLPLSNSPSSSGNSRSNNCNKDSIKSVLVKRRSRLLKESPGNPEKKNSLKSPTYPPTPQLEGHNMKGSPRKFPSNVGDLWKSTGMAIRGRGGRPRGSFRGSSRGGFRGSFRGGAVGVGRSMLRAERYNTRDSQKTGLMRSGKQRKCSDSNLVEGLEGDRKRRRVFKRIKVENNDFPPDEHSSFVTTSELSFCDNEISFKQSDDEMTTSTFVQVKVEKEENSTSHSRDTNSNVYKNSDGEQSRQAEDAANGIGINNQGNLTGDMNKNVEIKIPKKTWARGRKKRIIIERKNDPQSDCSIKDSDCSFDSDLVEDLGNSPKSGIKRQRRKGADGLWVRRSTRSVGNSSKSGDGISELITDKDFNLETESNSKSSLNIDSETNCDSFEMYNDNNTGTVFGDSIQGSSSNKTVLDTPVKKCESDTDFFLLSDVKLTSTPETTKDQDKFDEQIIDFTDSQSNASEQNSFGDFTLALEETPIKKVNITNTERRSSISFKLNLDSSSIKHPVDQPNNVEYNKLNDGSESLECAATTEDLIAHKPILDSMTLSKDDNKSSTENSFVKEIIHDENISPSVDGLIQSDSTHKFKPKDLHNNSADNEEEGILELMNEVDLIHKNKFKDDSLEIDLGSCEPSKSFASFENKSQIDESNKCLDITCVPSNENSSENYVTLKQTDTKENCVEEHCKQILQTPNENEMTKDFNATNIDMSVNKDTSVNDSRQEIDENIFEETLKMEIDLDIVDKAVTAESTEESSSSDSNSHLSEYMTTPIEKMSTVLTCGTNDSDISTILKQEAIEICDANDKPSDSFDTCDTQVNVPFHPNESSASKERDTNKDDLCTQRKSLENSNMKGMSAEGPSKELLSALGLQSTQSAAEEKPKRPVDNYTGTLKAVIKLNRSSDKRSERRQMIFKQGDKLEEDLVDNGGDRLEYRICSAEEPSTENVPLTHLGDIPANRKAPHLKVKSQFDLSNSPNIVGVSSGPVEASTDSTKEGGKQNLVIPEKSSSFSIHPERLCTDVCTYCFGKFGSLDTPCHLAQLKNTERLSKILAIEKHLSTDSCLCDGCFRYVDRKANCPASQRSRKPAARRGPLAGTICAVQDCTQQARHSVRRKWLIKLKKSIGKKLVIDMDKNPQLPVPLCSQHYYWVDYFTVCGICKKRLTRNHMYALGPEAEELNKALSDDGIPVRLSDKLFLCKLCRYYSNLRLKYQGPSTISSTHHVFLSQYRKKILRYYDIPVSESEEERKSVEEEVHLEGTKAKKKKSKSKSFDDIESKKKAENKVDKHDPVSDERSNESQMIDYSFLDTLSVHRDEQRSPTMDYSNLADIDSRVGFSNIASLLNPLEAAQGTTFSSDSQSRTRVEKPTRIQVKFGNLNIGKLSNLNIGQDSRPAQSATPSIERPPYLPGERELNLTGDYEFHGPLNPSSGWERCTYNVQFDRDTKKMWQDLQRPYGNQSSFLRHLVILEKHWRNGSLVFSENPNPKAVKYFNSVQNRVQAYDGFKASDTPVDKPKVTQPVTVEFPTRPMSTPVRVTSAPPPLMKIAPGSIVLQRNQIKKPPPYTYPVTSTQTSAAYSLPMMPNPPPYRLPVSRPSTGSASVLGTIATVKIPIQSSTAVTTKSPAQTNKHLGNFRPSSISHQQFKKIRLEQPMATASKITVMPKSESRVETQTTSNISTNSSEDFSPLICDVRSLANSNSDWTESFRKQQQKLLKQNVAKYYAPILPKVPHSLTVKSFPQSPSLVMKTQSLTIETAPSNSTKPNFAPPEKPSISVFREPTPGENG